MPFEIIRGDITQVEADAIVNTANPKPVVGYGVDAGIHQKAGPRLLQAREKIGEIPVGSAAVTPAYDLNAKVVIHAVGPAWNGGGSGEEALLRSAYDSALALAAEHRCRSAAFPLLSSGNYGFPGEIALRVALDAFQDFLMRHEMRIVLVVFDRASFQLSGKLFQSVRSYIDERYIQEKLQEEYDAKDAGELADRMRRRTRYTVAPAAEAVRAVPPQELRMPTVASGDLKSILSQLDAGFSETLFQLIDRSGMKDSEVYKRANIDRRLFSKMRSQDYRPSKSTALALAVALELSLDETRDLIGRAGYALTRSSKQDIIVEYFIEHRNYNIMDINAALFEFDQSLLGGA